MDYTYRHSILRLHNFPFLLLYITQFQVLANRIVLKTTKALRLWVSQRIFTPRNFLLGFGANLKLYIDFHAYGQYWLYPYGYTRLRIEHEHKQAQVRYHRQLRARRALMLCKDVSLSALLAVNRRSLNSVNALMLLNRHHLIACWVFFLCRCISLSKPLIIIIKYNNDDNKNEKRNETKHITNFRHIVHRIS